MWTLAPQRRNLAGPWPRPRRPGVHHHHSNASWIYWWLYEWRDFGWNIQRISPDDNVVRIQSMVGNDWCLGSRDDHATTQTDATLKGCDDPRRVDAAGQRWLAERYADGTIRLRNEANHLCLLAPDGIRGKVTLYGCDDVPAERWSVVNP